MDVILIIGLIIGIVLYLLAIWALVTIALEMQKLNNNLQSYLYRDTNKNKNINSDINEIQQKFNDLEDENKMYCSACGNENKFGDTQCRKCGIEISYGDKKKKF